MIYDINIYIIHTLFIIQICHTNIKHYIDSYIQLHSYCIYISLHMFKQYKHTHIIYNLLNKYNIPLNKHESPESHTCNYLDITLNHIIFLVLHMLIHYIHTEHCLDLRTGQRRPLSTTANSHAAGAGRKHAQA